MCAALHSDTPYAPILPASTARASAPTESAIGTFGSNRCM
jgi:hypothetical protein